MKPQIIMNSISGEIEVWTKIDTIDPGSGELYKEYYIREYPNYRTNWHTFEIDFNGVNKTGTNKHWTRYNPNFVSIGDL